MSFGTGNVHYSVGETLISCLREGLIRCSTGDDVDTRITTNTSMKHTVKNQDMLLPSKIGLADIPFNLLFSPRNPTSRSGLLRTRLTTIASFSRPWNPSTVPNSIPGYLCFSE